MPCNIIPKPWLTSHLNSAHWLTQLDLEISAGVSPYMQPIFIQVLTLEHQSNSTPYQFDWRRHFNTSTMLDLKGLWMHVATYIHRNFKLSMVLRLKCLLQSNWHGVKFDWWTSELILIDIGCICGLTPAEISKSNWVSQWAEFKREGKPRFWINVAHVCWCNLSSALLE